VPLAPVSAHGHVAVAVAVKVYDCVNVFGYDNVSQVVALARSTKAR
jgi:hypothetical protein